jgi:transposase
MTFALQELILCTSSNTGAWLAKQMGIQAGPRTLLRVVSHEECAVMAPRVLGIDDFAVRRGPTYGTVLCDLESGRPIDILLGRTAEPLTRWLKEHPGVEIIARDRATAYAHAPGLERQMPFRWRIGSTRSGTLVMHSAR